MAFQIPELFFLMVRVRKSNCGVFISRRLTNQFSSRCSNYLKSFITASDASELVFENSSQDTQGTSTYSRQSVVHTGTEISPTS